MPLPHNVKIPLHGHSQPNDPRPSKPKQVMVLKLSDSILEALGNSADGTKLSVRFGADGGRPGITVGDQFYPMQPLGNDNFHDIYLRSTPIGKPPQPLKQYGRVTGKLFVEGSLEGAEEKLGREKQAEDERRKRGRVEMFDPFSVQTSTSTSTRKKKAAPAVATASRRVEHARNASLSATNSAGPSRIASPKPPRLSPEPSGLLSTRSRMVHCLAMETQPQTTDDLIKRLGQSGADPERKRYLASLASQIAEPSGKQGHLRLKTRSWKEIRPYEWANASNRQRESMANQMRAALQELGTLKSDPLWRHSRPPNPPPPPASASMPTGISSSASANIPTASLVGRMVQPLPSRPSAEVVQASTSNTSVKTNGATAVKARLKKPEISATKPREPIQAKDEGMHATRMSRPTPAQVKVKNEAARRERPWEDSPSEAEGSRSASSSVQRQAPRQPPGSGYKRSPAEGSPTLPSAPTPSVPSSTVLRKPSVADARGPRQESPAPSGRSRPNPPATLPPHEDTRDRRRDDPPSRMRTSESAPAVTQRMKTEATLKRKDAARASDRERDTDVEQKPLRIKKKEKPKAEEGEIEQDERPPPKPTTNVMKRKIKREEEESDFESDATRAKKRRLAIEARLARETRPEMREARTSIDRRPVKREALSPPMTKIKREPSPAERVPAKRELTTDHNTKKEPSPAASTQSAKSKSSKQERRARARFTSSEDEGEIREPAPRKTRVKPEPVEPPSLSRISAVPPLPPGTDHATLRARYKKRYAKYLLAYQRVFAQVAAIKNVLDDGSDGLNSDDEEVVGEEQLKVLTREYREIEKELLELRERYFSEVGMDVEMQMSD